MSFEFITSGSAKDVLKVDVETLPFTYLDAYRIFVKKNYGTDIIIALNRPDNTFIAISIHKSKFITNAQMLSEPFSVNGPLEAGKQKQFFNDLLKAMKDQGIADRIITPQNFIVFGAVPDHSTSCLFGSYQVDLTPSEEILYAKVHSKHRNKISKAGRAGVEIKDGAGQLKVFYDLYKATMERSSMYCEPYEFFENYYKIFGEENCCCTVVYHNGAPQGGILAPYTRYCCYYVYGASADNITESGSINYLHWETMLLMKLKGVKAYDFVGARLSDVSNTKLEGIQSFKERFGGELRKGFLFKADINTTKCNVFDSMLKVNNKLRGKKMFKDIIDQEIEKQGA